MIINIRDWNIEINIKKCETVFIPKDDPNNPNETPYCVPGFSLERKLIKKVLRTVPKQHDHFIEAIRTYRAFCKQENGYMVGLKVSKDTIEKYNVWN